MDFSVWFYYHFVMGRYIEKIKYQVNRQTFYSRTINKVFYCVIYIIGRERDNIKIANASNVGVGLDIICESNVH